MAIMSARIPISIIIWYSCALGFAVGFTAACVAILLLLRVVS